MISDDERREIAKELRLRSCCEGFESCDKCKALSVRLFGDKWVLCQLDSCDANYWGALADLIDRPTCHDLVKHKQDPFIPGKQMADGYFHCSSCDWSGQLLEYIGFGGMLAYEPVHCPKCGEEIKR